MSTEALPPLRFGEWAGRPTVVAEAGVLSLTIFATRSDFIRVELFDGTAAEFVNVARKRRPDLYALGLGCLLACRPEPFMDALLDAAEPHEEALVGRAARVLAAATADTPPPPGAAP